MKKPRKIIVYIATSADGYIARPDGDVAWLDRPRPKGNYGMPAFFKSIDTILWGRKTYAKGLEMGMEAGMKAAGFGPHIKNYVFSRHPQKSTVPTFEFVNEPIKTFAQRLRALPMARHSERSRPIFSSRVAPATRSACAERNLSYIPMMGGGEIIASFTFVGAGLQPGPLRSFWTRAFSFPISSF
jgi:hypothetical protein